MRPPAQPKSFDLAIALDTAIRSRLGTAGDAVEAKSWINLDHHPTNPRYGDLNYIDPTSPATGQILYDFLASEKFPLNAAIAEDLFIAISTDTGSFQYPSTTARTFAIAAELVQLGVKVGRVSQQLYEAHPRRRTELLRELLGSMKFTAEDRIASFSLSLATTRALGVQAEDNEGLIDHLRAIEGVIVAVFFEELPDGKVRISMRSKSDLADVSAICAQFGGGGHKLASGARVQGSLGETEEKVLKAIHDVIDRNS